MIRWLALVALVMATTGCATQAQFLDSKQAAATETALTRARFEMNCPQATGTVLSREAIQPLVMAPMAGVGGVQRAEYTIGVAGCNHRATYVVICPDTSASCFAAGDRGIIRQ